MKALALVAVALAGAAGAPAPKATLRVAVSGQGLVTAKPGGLACFSSCAVRLRKGSRVVLRASPSAGYRFSHWSAPCGTSLVCTVRLTRARTVEASFVAPPPPPAPAPLPPPAKPGDYSGTYTDGTYFLFTVDASGVNAESFSFDLNGECADGGTSYGTLSMDGPFPIQADGSFSGTSTVTLPNGTATMTVAGAVSASGAAHGTLDIGLDFNTGVDCTSRGTWLAQDQS